MLHKLLKSCFLKCNLVCNFYKSPSTLNLPNIHRNVYGLICLSVTYVYSLEKSLAASGVCHMGRSGNNPSGHSLICFVGQSLQLRGLCINEPTSASMHNRPLPQGSIFLHMRELNGKAGLFPEQCVQHTTHTQHTQRQYTRR